MLRDKLINNVIKEVLQRMLISFGSFADFFILKFLKGFSEFVV